MHQCMHRIGTNSNEEICQILIPLCLSGISPTLSQSWIAFWRPWYTTYSINRYLTDNPQSLSTVPTAYFTIFGLRGVRGSILSALLDRWEGNVRCREAYTRALPNIPTAATADQNRRLWAIKKSRGLYARWRIFLVFMLTSDCRLIFETVKSGCYVWPPRIGSCRYLLSNGAFSELHLEEKPDMSKYVQIWKWRATDYKSNIRGKNSWNILSFHIQNIEDAVVFDPWPPHNISTRQRTIRIWHIVDTMPNLRNDVKPVVPTEVSHWHVPHRHVCTIKFLR